MPDVKFRVPRRLSTSLATSAAMLLACAVGGCEERESAKTIAKASRKMEASAIGSGTPEGLAKSLAEHAGALKGVANDTTVLAGEKSAASLLEAQGELAKAEQDASGLVPAEQEIRRKLGRAVQLSSLFALKSSTAKVAGDFDPSAQIAELTRSQQAKEQELADSRARLEVLSKELAGLRERAKGELASADEHFRKVASLKQSAASLSAQAGVTYIEQAAASQRLGDARRLAGEQLQAQADVLAPQVVEQESIIKQQENQRRGLLAAQEGLRTRQADSRKQAEEAREGASRIERDIEGVFNEAMALRDSEFQPSFDKAKSAFERAVSLARGAASDTPQDPIATAALTTASTQSSLASLHLTRAGLLGAMGDALDLLARTAPPLNRSGEFASMATQIRTERGEVVQSAVAALEAAKTAYGQAARIKDAHAKERLQQLGENIERLRARLAGDAADAPSDGHGGQSGSGESSAAGEGADGATAGGESDGGSGAGVASTTGGQAGGQLPVEIEGLKGMDPGARAAMDAMVLATREGRFDDLTAMTLAETEEGKALRDMGASMGRDFYRADKALRAKFNGGLADLAGKVGNQMVGMTLSNLAKNFEVGDDEMAQATFEGDGERVSVSLPSDPEPTKFVKKDGAWLIDAELDFLASNPQSAIGAKATAAAAKSFADQVDRGAYESLQAAADGFEQLFVQAIQDAMKAMQPPSGGG
jgi:hypothetical protein